MFISVFPPCRFEFNPCTYYNLLEPGVSEHWHLIAESGLANFWYNSVRDRMTLGAGMATLLAVVLLSAEKGLARAAISEQPLVRLSLVSDRGSIKPGEKFRLGALFDITDECHIYWKNPGDAGLPPEIKWDLPEGYVTGPLFWPTPERAVEPGDLVVNVYSHQVMFYVWVQPPERIQRTSEKFSVSANWLVCRKICVQEKADAGLVLPVSGKGSSGEPDLFNKYERLVPRPAEMYPELSVNAEWSEDLEGMTDRLGVITLASTGTGAPLADSVREAVWFDNPSDNVVSRSFHLDREHSNLDRLVFHLQVSRLESRLDWPSQWGGVLVTSLGGPDTQGREYRIEIQFSK